MQGPSLAKLDKIILTYRQRLALFPDDQASRLQVARALRLQGRFAESVGEYDLLARSCLQQQDLLGAISACTSILELIPDHGPTLELLDYLLGQQSEAPGSPPPLPDRLDDPIPLVPPRAAAPAAPSAEERLPTLERQPTLVREPASARQPTAPFVAASTATIEVRRVSRRPDPVAVPPVLPPPLPSAAPIPLQTLPTRWRRIAEQMEQQSDDELDRVATTPPPRSRPSPPPREERSAIPLLRLLDAGSLRRLLAGAQRIWLQQGERVLEEGQRSDSLFLVVAGSLRVSRRADPRPPLDLGTIPAGSYFGEAGLLAGQPSPASYVAESEAEVLSLDRSLLEPLLAQLPRLEKVLRSSWHRRTVSLVVGASALFRSLSLVQREQIAATTQARRCAAGEVILEAGEPEPSLVLVLRGEVEELAAARALAVRAAGDIAGLEGPWLGQPAEVQLRARGECEVLLLAGVALRQLGEREPEVAQAARQLLTLRRFVSSAGAGAGPEA